MISLIKLSLTTKTIISTFELQGFQWILSRIWKLVLDFLSSYIMKSYKSSFLKKMLFYVKIHVTYSYKNRKVNCNYI